MIKIAGSILIVLASSMIGYVISDKYKKRTEALREVHKILTMLISETKYKSELIGKAFKNISFKTNSFMSQYLLKISEGIESDKHCMLKEIAINFRTELNKSMLNKNDIDKLEDFIGSIGYCDKEMQINRILMYNSQIEEDIMESIDLFAKNSKLSRYIGLGAGIYICLLLW